MSDRWNSYHGSGVELARLVLGRALSERAARSAFYRDQRVRDAFRDHLVAWLGHRSSISGLRYARKILASRPLHDLIKAELLPGPGITSDADLAAHCRRTVKTNWHPAGTCRMGRDGDPGAVLDKRLRLRGIEGLRVIDASAMPLIPSGNTNAPTMALASRGVALLLVR